MPDDRLDKLDYYTLLGVVQDASPQDIRRAFRAFARRYHPDRFSGAPEEKRERATNIFRRGSEGLQVLCDAAARRLYDKSMKEGILRLTADQRDGAARAEQQPKRSDSGPTVRSPVARKYVMQASEAAKAKKFKQAWKLLKKASEQEPGNPAIEGRIQKVEATIRRLRIR